jgi:hypothetical protein
VAVVVERVAVPDLRVNAADREVHLGEPPGGVVRLLPVDGDVAELAGVRLDELLALHEHAARATAGVVNAALVGREHLDQHAHHVRRRVELPALLALRARELGEEILVHPSEDVLRAVGRAAQPDVGHQVDELAQALLVEARPREVFGQHPDAVRLKRRVVALDGRHRVVHQLADGRLRGVGLQMRPACLLRHPEDAYRAVLVGVLGFGSFRTLRLKFGVLRLEGVGDVLEEDQAENDVLVLGRIHVVAQGIGRCPELGLEPEVGGGSLLGSRLLFRHQLHAPYETGDLCASPTPIRGTHRVHGTLIYCKVV